MGDAELPNNSKWLLPALGSSLCWAISDVLCDVCIDEGDSDSDSEFGDDDESSKVEKFSLRLLTQSFSSIVSEGVSSIFDKKIKESPAEDVEKTRRSESFKAISPESKGSAARRRVRVETDPGAEQELLLPRSVSDIKYVDIKPPAVEEDFGMDGEQDAAVAGIVSMIFSYILCMRRWSTFVSTSSDGVFSGSLLLLWSPLEDVEWWFASCGGVMLYLHYILVLWAFDSAPSTVINPLVQMSSVWVLLGSAVPAFITGSTFMRPQDLLCYAIILVGGILPSLDGRIATMFTRKFWLRPFVRNVVLSEVTLGMYDLMISYCLQSSAKKAKFADLSATSLEDEFFYLAWCWFSISFAISFAFVPRLNHKLSKLLYLVPKKILFFSALSQMLTLLAFYFSAFAYAWFYQASVVHAAESSLEQAFNLLLAFILKKCFNLGRDSAVQKMKTKVISCVIVTIGLSLIAYQDQLSESFTEKSYYKYGDSLKLNGTISIDTEIIEAPVLGRQLLQCTRPRIGCGLPRTFL